MKSTEIIAPNLISEREREWMTTIQAPIKLKDRLTFSLDKVQAGIARPYPTDVVHGALVLLRINEPDIARDWLSRDWVTPGDDQISSGDVFRNLALTYSGLKRLGAPIDWLDHMPQEFIDGMEARAGVLGDFRSNHPEHWKLPSRNWPDPDSATSEFPIQLSTVHVLIQLRTALKKGEDTTDGTTLLERLANEIKALNKSIETGMTVLSIQVMKRGPVDEKTKASRDHFGYVDGISQPTVIPSNEPPASPEYWNDEVKPGELFLGYANDRGDAPPHIPREDPIRDNGSFLVLRKLRQFPDKFEAVLNKAVDQITPTAGAYTRRKLIDDFKAKIMGRRTDGSPLVKVSGSDANDFNYETDMEGMQCPFQSHIRRANSRTKGTPPPPRIARRGMSYGPGKPGATADEPRGLIFIAYNASIAEQFEVIQRWMAGGNSSGLLSKQNDPLLGVPEVGKRRIYRFEHDGQIMRIDLGNEPLVQLEWGLYAFVPSIAALKEIRIRWSDKEKQKEIARKETAKTQVIDDTAEPLTEEEQIIAGRLNFEVDSVRAQSWKSVREEPQGIRKDSAYGLLVGSKDKVLEVLKDDGNKFSVKGYGERMMDTIGQGKNQQEIPPFYLGIDHKDPGHKELGLAVNKIVETITEKDAFEKALCHAEQYLVNFGGKKNLTGNRKDSVSIDIIEFSRKIVALLCSDWFGLPDEHEILMKHGSRAEDFLAGDGIPRCPGDLFPASRYVFSTPHPLTPLEKLAKRRREGIEKAFRGLLHGAKSEKWALSPLVKNIVDAVAEHGDSETLQAQTVAGAMLGFPAPTIGSLVGVLINWIRNKELWELQLDLSATDYKNYALASEVLRGKFLKTMAIAPSPYAIWRTAEKNQQFGKQRIKGGCPIVVGLASGMADNGDHLLMFGGSRDESNSLYAPHACPGYALAMGVMLGCVAALLSAGALTPTSVPYMLTLTRGLKGM